MSDFADNHITDLGTAMLAQVMAGQGVLTFTKVVMGDGNMPSTQTPATMTDVVSPRAQASITKAVVAENGTAVVGARFSNESQESDFEWKELGLYAKVGESGTEQLYSYGWTPAGELIPAGTTSTTLIEKLVDVVTYVGDATEVTAIFDPDFIPQVSRISEESIASIEGQSSVDPTTGKSSEYLDRPGLSKLWADIKSAIDGAGPDLTADEVTITLADGSVITLKDGGVTTDKLADGSVTKAKLAEGAVDSTVIEAGSIGSSQLADGSVTTDKLADGLVVPVSKGGTGATDAATARENLGVTPGNIGAATTDHDHDAGDVTSGTLPLARGGTGVTTLDALRQEVLNFPGNDELIEYLQSQGVL